MASVDGMLVSLTLQGDADAFARLMERHRPGLLNLALSQVGSPSEAEDLVQEAFIQAYQHLATLHDRDKFPGWLYRIARNLCYAALRQRRSTLQSLEAQNSVEVSSESAGPEALVEGRELSESIVKAVAALPDKNQRVFLLYLEGWSYRDIATTFDLSTSTVLGRIQRSKQHVKEKLSKEGHFAVSPGPLQIERGYLREEIYRMSERILKPKSQRRRIYGIETEYELQIGSGEGKTLSREDAVIYFFREIITGRMYPDVFLENGARFYQDRGALPEYATPECDDLIELVAHEKAGERLLERLTASVARKIRADGFTQGMAVLKNTSGTHGCHENYLMDSRVSNAQLVSQLIPFLVTRQIFAGAGKVEPSNRGRYAISQRTEHIRQEISTKATESGLIEGIIHLRDDEPYADAEKYRRLHLTVGEANMSEYPTYLKVGTTEILLRMIEDNFLGDDLALRDSVSAIKQISADTTCTQQIELANGKQMSAIEMQQAYLESAKRYFDQAESDVTLDQIMTQWEDVLTRLEEDPTQLDREVDWVIKKKLIETEVARRKLDWDSAEVIALDHQYHNIQSEIGLYHKLAKEGRVERIVTDEQIDHAMHHPPQTTRAKFRGKYVKLANERKILCGVNWGYIQLYEPYQKLFLITDPFQTEFEAATPQEIEKLKTRQ